MGRLPRYLAILLSANLSLATATSGQSDLGPPETVSDLYADPAGARFVSPEYINKQFGGFGIAPVTIMPIKALP